MNKTSTTAQLRWNVNASAALTDAQKAMVRHALRNRITQSGDIVLSASTERRQEQNKATAIERLDTLVTRAITPRTRRIATKPTRASRERRIASKKIRSSIKRLRTTID